jgi:hypothetical protein
VNPRAPLLALLVAAPGALAQGLVNGGFEATPPLSGWVVSGAVSAAGGLLPGSTTSARLTGRLTPVQQIGQNVTWGGDWWLDCSFATTDPGADRAFNLLISAATSASNNGLASINLRHQQGAWQTYAGGSWGADLNLGTLLHSVDGNADGDLDDPEDTRHVYRLRVTGHDWGTPAARYDVALSDANSSVFAHAVTGLTRFQNAGATTSAPLSFLFTTAFDQVAGYWVDQVTSHEDSVAEAPQIDSFLADPPAVPGGTPVTFTWALSGGTVDTLELLPLGELPVAASGTNLVPAATTTYTLRATGPGGVATRAFTVAVDVARQPLRLTEFMASNQATIEDEDGDDSDWLEVHNPNPHSVNLAGYTLTDSAADPTCWIFPARVLDPGAHLLVWASGKDRADPDAPLHTNFQLAAGGEYLGLHAPGGAVEHAYAPLYPAQFPDVSYGEGLYFGAPTPGAPNLPGPFLRDPQFQAEPGGGLRVSARIDDAVSATLFFRAQFAAEAELLLELQPDGRHAAVIPAGTALPGQMLRWRFTATDAQGQTRRLPAFATPDAPEYLGTLVPDPALVSDLRVWHWFLDPAHFAAADTAGGARAAVWFAGEFHDNVRVSLRGATTAGLEKKPHKFEFHDSRLFRFHPDLPPVDEINLNAAYTDNSYLRDWLAQRDQAAAGVPAPFVEPVRLQRNGAFHSLAVMIENVDRRFLRRHGLDPSGPLFKATGNGSWLADHTGFETRNGASFTDLSALVAGIAPAAPHRATFVFDHLDLPNLVSSLAANALGSIYNPQKNYYLHLDRRRHEWMLLPWDRDFAYGDIYLGAGDPRQPAGGPSTRILWDERIEHGASDHDYRAGYNRLFDAAFALPAVREMTYRRLRTLLDSRFAAGGIEAEVAEIASRMAPEAELDRAAWGFTAGIYRQFGAFPFTTGVARIVNEYLPNRRTFLLADGGTPARGVLPGPQAAHPALAFGALEVNPPSGNQDEEFVEIVNPTPEAVDLTGWRVEGAVVHTFRPGTVIPAGGSLFLTPDALAFRARAASPRGGEGRFVQGGYLGHLSNFGETLDLRAADGTRIASLTYPGAPSGLQRWLVISELLPAPASPHSDAEYIELHNRSPDTALDLGGARFTAGIDHGFPDGLTLAPGERALLVYDPAAFLAAFPGSSVRLLGRFDSGRLNNGGERIRLEDADGNTVADFTYANLFPWPETSGGASLTFRFGADSRPDYAPEHWRASRAPGGTPGETDAVAWDGTPPALDSAADPVWPWDVLLRHPPADSTRMSAEVAPAPSGPWSSDAAGIARVAEAIAPDGMLTVRYRLHPAPGQTRAYVRARAEAR